MTVDIDELLAESCEYNGVPEYIEDPEVLARIAALIRAERKEASAA
jgi:hypothetical protein